MLKLKLQYFDHLMQRTDFIWKDADAGKDWRWEEKGMTEDEMVGWNHWLNGHEFEQAPRVHVGQGSLVCFSPWGCKESDPTEWLNWTERLLPCSLMAVFLLWPHMAEGTGSFLKVFKSHLWGFPSQDLIISQRPLLIPTLLIPWPCGGSFQHMKLRTQIFRPQVPNELTNHMNSHSSEFPLPRVLVQSISLSLFFFWHLNFISFLNFTILC